MIRIKYRDGSHDCVADFMLETLISLDKIEAFTASPRTGG